MDWEDVRIVKRRGGSGYGKFMREGALERLALQGLDQLSEVRGQDDADAMDWFFDDADHSHHEAVQAQMSKTLVRRTKGSMRGRPPTDPEDIEEAAKIYQAATEKPLQAVVDGQGVSRPTASRRIAKARERGLLPATTKGKVTR